MHWRRTFLKRHIAKYLEQHIELPPKAVVLVALLQPSALPGTADATAASTAERLQGAQERLALCGKAAGPL